MTDTPRLALAATLASASLVMASTTCVTATIPAIGADLGSSQTQIQWIADAYPVVLAALLLPAGALLDRWGRRKGLLLGVAGLVASLLWAASADSSGELIAARAVAGIAGALMFPATLATITGVFGPERRMMAVSLWASAVMAGGGYGLVVGGLMVETTSWHDSFVVVAGIGVVCLLLVVAGVPETRDPEHANLDPVGAVLSCVAVGGVTVGIIEMPVKGIEDVIVWGSLVIGLAAGALFIAWELRVERPLLDVRLFATHRMFAVASLWLLVMFGVAFGWFFLTFQYCAYVLGWGPLESTLGLMAMVVPLVIVTPFGGLLAQRFGIRRLLVVSTLLLAAAAALTGLAGSTRDFWWIGAGLALFGLAGVGQGPATQAIVQTLPLSKQGVASAVNDVSRELGAALGIAILGSAFTTGYHASIDALDSPVPEVVRSAPAAGLAAAAQTPDPDATVEVVRDATVEGWELGLLTAAGVLVGCAVVTGIATPSRRREPAPVPA